MNENHLSINHSITKKHLNAYLKIYTFKIQIQWKKFAFYRWIFNSIDSLKHIWKFNFPDELLQINGICAFFSLHVLISYSCWKKKHKNRSPLFYVNEQEFFANWKGKCVCSLLLKCMPVSDTSSTCRMKNGSSWIVL